MLGPHRWPDCPGGALRAFRPCPPRGQRWRMEVKLEVEAMRLDTMPTSRSDASARAGTVALALGILFLAATAFT